jgi:hypothetical protein
VACCCECGNEPSVSVNYGKFLTLYDTKQSLRLSWTSIQPVAETLPDNTRKRQTSMPPVGFGPDIPASDRPQSLALDRSATGIG